MKVVEAIWIPLCLLCVLVVVNAQEDEEEVETESPRKIKGEQLVKQTMIAKIVGAGGLSDDMLNLIKQDNIAGMPQNVTLVYGNNGTDIPQLVTENVKTTVTRITIPLSTSFMDSEWYRDTLKKFLLKNKIAIMNQSTGKQFSENGTDIDLVLLKLWAAATLRDNIVTVFGYLLYHRQPVLPGDMHSALVQIYDVVRLRRVSIVGVLDALQEMSFESPQNQFLILFEQLDKVVPKYLRSCVTYWLENLQARTIDMDNIILDKDDTLIVDLLAGIESSAVLAIKQQLLFPKSIVQGSLKINEDLLGKILAYVISGITQKSIKMKQQLFAGILLHLPLNNMKPDVDEYERYLIDLLKRGKRLDEQTFDRAMQKLDFEQLSNPFELVKSVLKAISAVNILNSEQLEVILMSIENTTNTYSLKNHDVLTPIISSEKINIEVLLSGIVPEEFPPDVVDAKDRLLYYIEKRYIDLELALRGFIKHKHITATELLIATLTRIEIRSINLAREVASTVSALKAHIIFKRALNNLRLTISVVDLTTLLSSFQSPQLPSAIRVVAAELKMLLQTEFIDLQFQLNKQSIAQCSRPRQCVINIFKFLLMKSQIRNKLCELKMKELLKLVDPQGEPITTQRRSLTGRRNCDLEMPLSYENAKMINKEHSESEKEIYPGKYNPSPYKNVNLRSSVYERPIYISRPNRDIIITGYDGEVWHISHKFNLTDLTFENTPLPHPAWPNNGSSFEQLLPLVEKNSPDEEKLQSIKHLLQRKDVMTNLGIIVEEYPTRGTLLLGILKKSLNDTELFRDEKQKTSIQAYARLLEYAYKVLPPPPTTNGNQIRLINYGTLLQAIPVPNDETSVIRLEKLKSFMKSDNFSVAVSQLDLKNYPTKGLLLKHILQHLTSSANLSDPQLLEAIRFFQQRVKTVGYGAQPVEWLIVIQKVNLKEIDIFDIFSVLDPKSFPSDVRKSLYAIYDYLLSGFSSTAYKTGLKLKSFKTKEERLSAFLDFLSTQIGRPDLMEAFSTLKNFVKSWENSQNLIRSE